MTQNLADSAGHPSKTGADQEHIWRRYRSTSLPELALNEVIRGQLQHRSVRKFLNVEMSDETLRTLVAAAQSASSSSNMQTWSVVAIRDPKQKARLAELSNHQDFMNEAGVLLIWLIDYSRILNHALEDEVHLPATEFLEAFMVGAVDASLAAQNATVAAESLGLGVCYIGAARNHPDQIAEVLNLPQYVFPIFGLIVGVPDPSEKAAIRPRLAQESVLHFETYNAETSNEATTRYEASLNSYFEDFGRTHSWRQRNLWRLASIELMQGRDHLVKHIESQGFTIR
ncbi:MAG: NADPH-dependent oxidoreductase [Microbacteriaceae bacterium]